MLTNSQGFKRFFELYFEPVYRFVRKYTEEDAIARDITQDTFIRLYERRRDFDVPEKAKSFIYITARNLCLDHLKHQKIKQQYQQTQSVSEAKDPDFLHEITYQETLRILHQAIDTLPPQTRKIILLGLNGKNNNEIAEALNEGHDMMGHELGEAADFYIGTTANPGADDLDKEIRRLEGKKKAGAQFIQTQPIYDIRQAENFLAAAKDLSLPILFGIVPLKSFKMANYLNSHVPGIFIPPAVMKAMETGGRETGIALSRELVQALRDIHADGAHLMPVNDVDAVAEICRTHK